jgi:hypothetical protein
MMIRDLEIFAQHYKFVAVINQDINNPGVAMNVIAHLSAGLVGSAPTALREKMAFIDFKDKDNGLHPSISALSLIVLRGKNGEIARLKSEAILQQVHFIDFLESMRGDTYQEQLERTAATAGPGLIYYGIILFGTKDALNPLTKKFSIWR